MIGNVTIGDNSSVWFNCVLRGDTNAISIGQRTNIQDGTIIHVDPGPPSTIIGDDFLTKKRDAEFAQETPDVA